MPELTGLPVVDSDQLVADNASCTHTHSHTHTHINTLHTHTHTHTLTHTLTLHTQTHTHTHKKTGQTGPLTFAHEVDAGGQVDGAALPVEEGQLIADRAGPVQLLPHLVGVHLLQHLH